ncbi:MAG: 16S rRNA (adenine(1518)-N(6)/adenine(1519)-N(6))-dimethyltransferase RsmA [Bacteroidales bacterium]|nr:16S rRNA (adenine(1518)-N(6)/adenine(1519)-N(6))-dimethyltransferase RsmA [Bacteroidales bacterium]
MNSVKPKKQLGQHFLTDMSVAQRIADSLDYAGNVLEIGPGMGVLSQFLFARSNVSLKLVEIDSESVEYLSTHFADHKDRIIEADFLKTDVNALFPGEPFAIISNFPYNISSQIFFRIIDFRDSIPLVVGMLQKEVAERLASPPGSRDYGILSVFLQAYYDIEYLFTVPPTVFNPPPKVQSGVIRCTRNSVKTLDCDEVLFRQVVKATFNQRRKTIWNGLKALGRDLSAIKDDAFMTRRPEQLSVADFVALTNLISGASPATSK